MPKELPFADRSDFADARRGFIAALPDGVWSPAPARARCGT